jgi:hypothetical protein
MTTDKAIGAELRAALARSLSGDEVPEMDKDFWIESYTNVSAALRRIGAENDKLRIENQKLRLSLMMFGDERFEN